MNYSLLDDSDWDEWERRRQEADELGALLGSGPDIGPLPSTPPPDFESAQMAPLNLDDIGSDWTTAIGAGAAGLGAIADLALNKGRNTGAILSAGAAGANQAAGLRLNELERATQYEQARARQGLERAQLAERAKYNQYLYDSMGQRGDNQLRVDADRDATRALREQSLGQNAQRIAQADTRIAQGDRRLDQIEDLGLAQDKSAASTRGRIGAELEMSDDTSDAAALRAQKVQAATQEGAIERIEAGHRARSAAERESAGRREIGNTEVIDEGVYKSLGTKQVNDANDVARAKVTFEQAMNDMAAIQARNGMQALPSGDKAAYDTAQAAAIGSLTTLFQTGVINEAEYQRYRERIPASGVTGASALGAVSQAVGGPNIVGDQIGATRDELTKIFDAGLSQYGLRGKRGGAQPQQHDRLPVTNQKRSQVPLVSDVIQRAPGAVNTPSAAPSGGGVMMVDPEGETGMVPAHMVQQALQAGYRQVQ